MENKLPKILNYSGEFDGEFVKYGCRKFKKEEYIKLYEVLKTFNIKSYKIGAGEIMFEDIEKMILSFTTLTQ